MKKWFYTYYVNHNSVSVWETGSYSEGEGYDTELEATLAAIKEINRQFDKNRTLISIASDVLINLTKDHAKLIQRLNVLREIK